MWAAEDLGDEKLRSLKANGFFPQGSLFPWIIFIWRTAHQSVDIVCLYGEWIIITVPVRALDQDQNRTPNAPISKDSDPSSDPLWTSGVCLKDSVQG